jgi:two-component system response regulator YesN
MLRVLIADDEERICQLILALGEWQKLGLEVVGTAQNGPDALHLVRTLLPDILITDIRMPGCDGLKVVEEARKVLPELEVIVISGYAQFDYAQTAIRYGVGEYLLKPINRDALHHSLEKMVARCQRRLKEETDIETLLESRDDDRLHLRQKLVHDLLAGRLEADTPEGLSRTYHFAASQAGCQILLVKLDYAPDDFAEPSRLIVEGKVRELVAPVLAGVCADAVEAFADACMVCVLCCAPAKQEALRQQLRTALNQLVAEKGLYGPIAFSMALGALCDTPAALPAALIRAQNLLAERMTEGTGRLLEGEAGRGGLLEMDFQARYADAAAHAIDVMGQSEADAAAAVLQEAVAMPGARGWELLALARAMGRLFLTRLGVADFENALQAYEQRLAQCGTAKGLTDILAAMQRDALALAAQRLRERDTQPIRNAKLYIRKNYALPITLEEVSAAIGFSVNYFSTLFKKETGEGFARYLTRVRVDEARQLLRDTGAPVAEICKSVGYGDLKHFTRTFKAETGLTPGEYRKLYG